MHPGLNPPPFWTFWLAVVSFGVMAFGFAMVVLPGVALQAFSLFIYSDAGHLTSFGPDAVAYLLLVHTVIGSIMIGWSAALLSVICKLFTRGERLGWVIIAVSVISWFIPDTILSLWFGFPQNAALNLLVLILFAIPLISTRRVFFEST